MIQDTVYNGSRVYYLADDMGNPWSSGWYDLDTAEQRHRDAEACAWDADAMPDDHDVEIDERGNARERSEPAAAPLSKTAAYHVACRESDVDPIGMTKNYGIILESRQRGALGVADRRDHLTITGRDYLSALASLCLDHRREYLAIRLLASEWRR